MKLAILLLIAVISLRSQEIPHTTEPTVIHRAEPQYTKEALDAKLQGQVRLLLTIGVDGIPADIKVVRGLGRGLDEKAVECLQQWRFKPATRHGEPVDQKVTFEMNFHLPLSSSSK
jgi:protein TonB